MKFVSLCLLALVVLSAAATAQSSADTTKVEFKTTLGNFTVLLYEKEAPISAKNFLAYVDTGFYGGLTFHRVIRGFMVQGGGFMKNMTKRPPLFPPIKNESDNYLKNDRGTIAMARTNDPHSATSQFFVNLVDNTQLNISTQGWGYAVFGKVIEGMETIDKIAGVATESKGPYNDVPATPVIIISAKRK